MKLTPRAKQMLFSLYEGRAWNSILQHGGWIKRSGLMGGATSRLYSALEDGGYIVKGQGRGVTALTDAGRAVAEAFQAAFWTREPFHKNVKMVYGGHPCHGMTAMARPVPGQPGTIAIQIDKKPFLVDGERWDQGWHEVPRWWARKREEEL